MAKTPPAIRELTAEELPRRPRSATTDRPLSEDARRIIVSAQAEAIRRAPRRRRRAA